MTRSWIVGACALLAALALAGSGPAGDGRGGSLPGFTLQQARAFEDFPLLYAGDRADGLPLVALLRRSDTADFVSFVYGDCVPSEDAGCAPPAEIQVWPACRRYLALYGSEALAGAAAERTSIRGVPAALLDEGTRVELQTGSSTVVVFADSRARAASIARMLRPLAEPGLPGERLPPPAPGAREGTLAC